jgi:outer membrane protein assembly factor BamB
MVVACLLAGMHGPDVGWAAPLEVEGRLGDPVRRIHASGRVEEVPPQSNGSSGPARGAGDAPGAAETMRASSVTAAATSSRITIDSMTTVSGSNVTYDALLPLELIGRANVYTLSDGSSWSSGAGSFTKARAQLNRVETAGSTIRYVFDPPADGVIYRQTDFDAGSHSAQGTLGADGPLVLEAEIGSTTAVMRGGARILANDATTYGEPRFNYYSVVVGSVVPFEVAYRLGSGTWTETTFDAAFSYTYTGVVDFAHPLSTPELLSVTLMGSSSVPVGKTVEYRAVASYAGGATKPVTDVADWSAEPLEVATVAAGTVMVQSGQPGATFSLLVAYEELGRRVMDERTVTVIASSDPPPGTAWGTFQGNASHTGYVPVSLDPGQFGLRWEREVMPGRQLNPVAMAEGRVFASTIVYFNDEPQLFALDVRDGATLWSKSFGDVFSVNPPAAAYGNVYVQTGNHGTDTFLRAFDAATGDVIFTAPHAAQWERYYAPTIVDGTVYVNGGYYGGAYAFDAFSGIGRWFLDLPQYDQWTPAVDAARIYAYVGEYAPGLYVADRATGALEFMIPDDNFDWNGWSMNLAPVLGSLGNVVAIHDGRLISFDPVERRIAWELDAGYSGQPAVCRGEIYATALGALSVLDEATGAPKWSWTPPAGEHIREPIVVTDTHVLVATTTHVHAIEQRSHASEWSYPVSGRIALADGTLAIVSATGILTIIDLGGFVPSPPVSVEVSGPATLVESSGAQYTATVTYADGRVRDRTAVVTWSIETDAPAGITSGGRLDVGELAAPQQTITVTATYSELGVTVSDAVVVTVSIGVGLESFVQRSLAAALAIQQQVAADLEQAQRLQDAARAVLDETPSGELPWTTTQVRYAHALTRRAMARTRRSLKTTLQCTESLEDALATLDEP